jgi:hypothetical protein
MMPCKCGGTWIWVEGKGSETTDPSPTHDPSRFECSECGEPYGPDLETENETETTEAD